MTYETKIIDIDEAIEEMKRIMAANEIIEDTEQTGSSKVIFGFHKKYFIEAEKKGFELIFRDGDNDYPSKIIDPNYKNYHAGYGIY